MKYDCIIVGAGAAGLSAALILGRCRRRVLVCDVGEPRNARANAMHGYLSRDGVPPLEFLRIARREVEEYPSIEFLAAEVTDARRAGDGFTVVLADRTELRASTLLLATGVVDDLPDIDGLRSLYGTSVHHCPYCDGWEWRDQPIAIYGRGEEASGLALGLTVWSDDLVLCTDGPDGLTSKQREQLDQAGIQIREEEVVRLEGQRGWLSRIIFAEGTPLPRRALFLASGQHQRSDLALRLGCTFNQKGAVDTGDCEATNVPGLYVAGDASKEAQFVVVAAAEGSEAGMAINKALLKDELHQNRNSRPSRTSRGGPYAKSG
jgi:thioredoxin reductase